MTASIVIYGFSIMVKEVPCYQPYQKMYIFICTFQIIFYYILYKFDAFVCQIFIKLIGMGLRWYITISQDILE
jgi:hypothetical protein